MKKKQPKFLRTISIEAIKSETQSLTAISLFSGCGGMDLGITQAGWEVRVMIEKEKMACDTLRANFTRAGWKEYGRGRLPPWFKHIRREPVILCTDITTLPTTTILDAAGLRVGEAGLVCGGFPCQGFSTSNSKRNERFHSDKRNELYLECVRVVREALPKLFVFENVPGILSMQRGTVMEMICRDLAKCGYLVHWQKLNAADYGVPQERHRIFWIGQRRDALVTNGKTIQLHLGVAGDYEHPDFFLKMYPHLRRKIA